MDDRLTANQQIGKAKRPSRRVLLAYFAVFSTWLVVAFAIAHVHHHWWFEDDPFLYGFSMRAANPFEFFYDKTLFHTEIGSNEVIPLLFASFWVDGHLAPLSAQFAYFHQSLAILLAAFGIVSLASRLTGSRLVAACCAATWLLLPSTLAVLEFLSTRDYVEGMILAILATRYTLTLDYLTHKKIQVITFCLILIASIGAILAKEFFPTTLLLALFLLLMSKNNYRSALSIVLVGCLYAAYRLHFVGFDLTYGMPTLGLAEYLKFVAKLPYFLTGSWSGYALEFAAIAGIVASRAKISWKEWAFWGLLLFSCLATIFPVSYALSSAWQVGGTWYRTLFVLNTVVVLIIFRLISKLPKKFARILLVASPLLALGGQVPAAEKWTRQKAQYLSEGKFFLSNPGVILFSELPAPWFLPGLSRLYNASATANIITHGYVINHETVLNIQAAKTIWRYDGNSVTEDPDLWRRLMSSELSHESK